MHSATNVLLEVGELGADGIDRRRDPLAVGHFGESGHGVSVEACGTRCYDAGGEPDPGTAGTVCPFGEERWFAGERSLACPAAGVLRGASPAPIARLLGVSCQDRSIHRDPPSKKPGPLAVSRRRDASRGAPDASTP
jgi:hypothetical protein